MRPFNYLIEYTEFLENGEATSSQREEFIGLLAEAYPRLYRTIISLVGNISDAEDVLQDVSLVLWEKYKFLQTDSNFTHWATGVSVNVCRNFLRKQQRRKSIGLDENAVTLIAHVQQGTQELLELRREKLKLCLNKLAEHERKLISDYYQESQSLESLAEQIGEPSNRLAARLYRIRKKLFQCINFNLKTGGY